MRAISIRDAKPRDLPALVRMGGRFHEVSKAPGRFCIESFASTCTFLMSSPLGILKISDKGMIGVLIYPLHYNAGELAAMEIFWWSEPGEGRALMQAAEEAARKRGAGSMTMVCLESLRPESVGCLYERAGYRPQEHSYVKVL